MVWLYLGTKNAVNQIIKSVIWVNPDLFDMYIDAIHFNCVCINTVNSVKCVVFFIAKLEQN